MIFCYYEVVTAVNHAPTDAATPLSLDVGTGNGKCWDHDVHFAGTGEVIFATTNTEE